MRDRARQEGTSLIPTATFVAKEFRAPAIWAIRTSLVGRLAMALISSLDKPYFNSKLGEITFTLNFSLTEISFFLFSFIE